jgi:hypothetical protein
MQAAKADIDEIRRLVLEREAKKLEMDALDLALKRAVGIDLDRPNRKKALSESDFVALCGGVRRERVSKKKRQPLDSRVA